MMHALDLEWDGREDFQCVSVSTDDRSGSLLQNIGRDCEKEKG